MACTAAGQQQNQSWHPAYDAKRPPKDVGRRGGLRRSPLTACPCTLTNHPLNEDPIWNSAWQTDVPLCRGGCLVPTRSLGVAADGLWTERPRLSTSPIVHVTVRSGSRGTWSGSCVRPRCVDRLALVGARGGHEGPSELRRRRDSVGSGRAPTTLRPAIAGRLTASRVVTSRLSVAGGALGYRTPQTSADDGVPRNRCRR